jgi:hypothetical protein
MDDRDVGAGATEVRVILRNVEGIWRVASYRAP